jgi:hypothetical protein
MTLYSYEEQIIDLLTRILFERQKLMQQESKNCKKLTLPTLVSEKRNRISRTRLSEPPKDNKTFHRVYFHGLYKDKETPLQKTFCSFIQHEKGQLADLVQLTKDLS